MVSMKMAGMITLAYRSGTVAGIAVTSDLADMTAPMQNMVAQKEIVVRRDQVLRLTCPYRTPQLAVSTSTSANAGDTIR